jgi:hypothetical protein
MRDAYDPGGSSVMGLDIETRATAPAGGVASAPSEARNPRYPAPRWSRRSPPMAWPVRGDQTARQMTLNRSLIPLAAHLKPTTAKVTPR